MKAVNIKWDTDNKVKFTVACVAVYKSELEIPKELKSNKEEVLKYIHEKLDECKVEELEWLKDLEPDDAVTMEDIMSIENENVDIPNEIIIPDSIKNDEVAISDYISNFTGWCHKGFELEED